MNILEDGDDIFKIPDTSIATWLYISGIKYIDTDISEFPAVHRFRNPKDGTIGKLLADWEDGRTQGDTKTYYRTYKRLVREAKKATSLLD